MDEFKEITSQVQSWLIFLLTLVGGWQGVKLILSLKSDIRKTNSEAFKNDAEREQIHLQAANIIVNEWKAIAQENKVQVVELTRELEAERMACDKRMTAMTEDYTHKIDLLTDEVTRLSRMINKKL